MCSPCKVLIIPSSQGSLTDKLVARWFGLSLKLIEKRQEWAKWGSGKQQPLGQIHPIFLDGLQAKNNFLHF